MRSSRRGGVRAFAGGCTAAVAAAVVLAAGPAGGAAPVAESAGSGYRGFVSLLGGGGKPVRTGSQGAGWRLSFREQARGRVRYKACLKHLDPPRVSRCWRRRTPSSGRQDVFVAL